MRALHKDRSWCIVLKKTWSTGEGMTNHLSILALRPHEQYEKAKKYDTER